MRAPSLPLVAQWIEQSRPKGKMWVRFLPRGYTFRMPYQYAYLLMVGVFGVVWLSFFILRKDMRHQQLFVSMFTAPLGPVTQILWFYKDYWRPEYVWTVTVFRVPVGIEELLFAFFIGGIGSVMYEVVFRKAYRRGHRRIKATIFIILFVGVTLSALKVIGWNTVWASSIALILASVVMIYLDKDLRWDWAMSSVLMFFFVIAIYLLCFSFFPAIISKFWVPTGLSGFNLLGIPVEELVWFVSWAMFSGVAYEFTVDAGQYIPLRPAV